MPEESPINLHLKSRSVLSRERLDGEVVAIDFESGNYFSFDGSAADIFWLLENEVAFSHWNSILAMHYTELPTAEQLEQELLDFIGKLRDLGLVTDGAVVEGASIPLPPDCVRGSWEQPDTQANSELADLLIIDPIHDTGIDGWPEIKSD